MEILLQDEFIQATGFVAKVPFDAKVVGFTQK
jgi:hypothetical protein